MPAEQKRNLGPLSIITDEDDLQNKVTTKICWYVYHETSFGFSLSLLLNYDSYIVLGKNSVWRYTRNMQKPKKGKKREREKKMAFFVQKNALEQVNALSTNDNIKKVPTLRNVDDFCQSSICYRPSPSLIQKQSSVRVL